MATLEVSPLLNSELRRSSRLTSREKPSYNDIIPITEQITSLKKRGRPKKEKPSPKIIPKKSPKKKGRPVNEKKVKKSAPRKKIGPPKKKPRLVRNPILEGMITEELAEVAEGNGNLDPLPVAVKSSKTRVKETLRAFTSHYLYFVQVIICLLF